MPSVIASTSDEVDELIDELVDRNLFDSRSEAAAHMVEYAAANKYGLEL